MDALCLIGPTASGKSHLAYQIAKQYQAEIISVDSALVYRGMDIGTAKPSQQERYNVTHHLIDIIDPTHVYSAANFCHDAKACIADVYAKGKLPLLVGGTLLYIHALEFGLAALPQANPKLRHTLNDEAMIVGWPILHQRLTAIDPLTAARIAPNDAQRIQRAWEVFLLSGQPLSTLLKQTHQPFKLAKLALIPSDRIWLRDRIKNRFQRMLDSGFLKEIQQLRQHYPSLHAQSCAMRTVGYRHGWQYLDGKLSYDEFVTKSITATCQLAKRQLTWLRKMDNLTTLDCQQDKKLLALTCQWVEQHRIMRS